MRITLGFSPCPNDTFIFDALVNNKIDTGGLQFDVVLDDVQTLNEWAKKSKLDVSKISYGVLPVVAKDYVLLNSGGALGKGVGPLLVSKRKIDPSEIIHLKIAVPGENTTAHMLFNMVFPGAEHKRFMVFHQVEDAVLNGDVDAGVIIHENRFTYEQKGLQKIMDLGEFWELRTGVPIPLGGIVAKRSLDVAVIQKVDALIRQSLQHAFERYPEVSEYVRTHAQEMNEDVMRKHIDLYVNNFSLDLGDEGRQAVVTLLKAGNAQTDNVFRTGSI